MDWYTLFKFLHVLSVIVWLGGGFALVTLGIFAERAHNNAEFGRLVDHIVFLSPRLFVPSSIAAIVFGLLAAYVGSWYGQLWVWLGLAGFAATFITGNFVLRPRSEQVARIVAAEGYSDRAVAMGSELLSVAKFDFFMLFVVVADMVFRPGFGDWVLLLIFVLVLAGAAYLFIRPMILNMATAVGLMK